MADYLLLQNGTDRQLLQDGSGNLLLQISGAAAGNRRRRFFQQAHHMIPARQSTALELSIGPVLDSSGVAVTDCVVGDFKLKKTTGNFAALNASATLTHVSAGTYDLVLTTSDTDTVGLCSIAIDDTTNACAPVYLQVIEEAVYDALYAASALGYVAGATVNVTSWNSVSLGTTNPLPNAVAGASGGLLISGSNSGTTTLGALTVTGATTLTGNVSLGGTLSVSGTTSFAAVTITATGSSSGLTITGGPTCSVTQGALQLVGGSTSGAGMSMSVTDGHGMVITAAGAGRHGMFITGGSSGVANGAYFVAGGTGFGVRATSMDLVSNLSVGGTTTLTGAVTASNASNSITGITVAALANDSITSSAIATSAGTELAGAVWDLATSGHTTSGTFGAAVVAAGSAGDPWSTSLPGAYSSGTAGYIVGTNLDAAVTSRMATYSQPTGFLAATFPATVASTTNITTVGAVSGNVSGSVGSLATQAKADVNAEVVDALATDTYAEPGQGAPSATTSLSAKLNYLYKWARNKVTQTSSQTFFYADDGTTVDHKATTSDNGTTFSRGEIASGP